MSDNTPNVCKTCGGEGRIRDHIDRREMAEGRGYGWHKCPDCSLTTP